MTVCEYFNRCANLDWFAENSDDWEGVASPGMQRKLALENESKLNPQFAKIFSAWRQYNYSGLGYGGFLVERPKLEDFLTLETPS